MMPSRELMRNLEQEQNKRLRADVFRLRAQLKEAREIIANLLDLDVEDVSPTAVWDRAEAFLKETE